MFLTPWLRSVRARLRHTVRRGQSAAWRAHSRSQRAAEFLEDRTMLDASSALQQALLGFHGADLMGKDGPMVRAGFDLTELYYEYQEHQLAGQPASSFNSQLVPGARVENGRVGVDLTTSGDPAAFRTTLEGMGLLVTGQFRNVISGLLPLDAIDNVAGVTTVVAAGPSYAMTSVGLTTSQGDRAQFSDLSRQVFGFDGTGITIGTLSDSFDNNTGNPTTTAAQDVLNGDLPANLTILDDSVSGTDEGRGMMQLITDVAPGAAQAFHTAFGGIAGFAQGILDLAASGSDVIVDDVSYLNEPFFQDGVIAQAVNQVSGQGIPYLSSAGNQGRDSYESGFRNSGLTGPNGGLLHDFDPGLAIDTAQSITVSPRSLLRLSFQWDQPFASSGGLGSGSDIDVYLVNALGTVLAQGITQNIGGDAVELVQFQNFSFVSQTVNVVIEHRAGPFAGLMKYVAFAGLQSVNEFATNSSTVVGHHTAAGGVAVGAAGYNNTPDYGVFPPIEENFSSAGGTSILFDTSGLRLASAQVRQQPLFTAPDGSNTTFFGNDSDGDTFPNFFGTSAAAPHAAAVAGLMLDAAGGGGSLTPTAVYNGLAASAIDMGTAGYDFDTGFGLINASVAVGAVIGALVIDANQTAGDGVLTGGGDADLIQVVRSGANLRILIDGTLSQSTPFANHNRLVLIGSRDGTTFELDFAGGNVMPAGGVDVLGRSTTDILRLINGTATAVDHTFTNQTDGQVSVDGVQVRYTGLDPITDSFSAVDRSFTFAGSDDAVSIVDIGGPDGFMRISSVSTSELVDFRIPTGTLQIDLGDGTNSLTVSSIDTGFNVPVTVLSGSGDDQITTTPISTAVVIFSGAGNDVITTGTGADSITAGDGNDSVSSGDGADTVLSDRGADTVRSGNGTDTVGIGYTGGAIDIDLGSEDDLLVLFDQETRAVGSVTVRGGAGNDDLIVQPLINANISVDGQAPAYPSSPGDDLTLVLSSPLLLGEVVTDNVTGGALDGTGSVTSSTHGTVTFNSIEGLASITNGALQFEADDAFAINGSASGDGTADSFSIIRNGVLAEVRINGAIVQAFPIVGITSVTINGSADNDTFSVLETGGLIPFPIFYNGGESVGDADGLRVVGGPGADTGTYRPDDAVTGSGVVTVVGRDVTFTGLEPVEVSSFSTFTFQSSNSEDAIQLAAGLTLSGAAPALVISGSSSDTASPLPFEELRVLNVDNLVIDLATSDGSRPSDTVTIQNEALRFDPADPLTSLTIQTGNGQDTVTVNDGDFRLPGAGTPVDGLVIDGGAATDTIAVVAQDPTLDLLEAGLDLTLLALTSADATLTGTFSGQSGTMTLRNFVGEQAVLTGNSTSNVFDLSGWNRQGTAIINGTDPGAGTDSDTLIGVGVAGTTSVWAIVGPDAGNVGGFQFTNVENLTGSSSNDRFVFSFTAGNPSATGSVSGQITADTGLDTLDFGAYLTPISFILSGDDATGYRGTSPAVAGGFFGIDSLAGGSSTNDVLNGQNEQSLWTLSTTNTVQNLISGQTLSFSGIERLNGGTQSDEFVVTGVRAHSINSGAGTDIFRLGAEGSALIGDFNGGGDADRFDLSAYVSSRTVTLLSNTPDGYTGTEASVTQGFTGVDEIYGSASTQDLLIGLNTASTWTISGNGAGTYTDSITGRSLGFGNPVDATSIRGFENLTGGSGTDTFRFANGGNISGNLIGGGNADTLIGDDTRLTEQFLIDGANTGRMTSGTTSIIGGRFSLIETLVGAAGSDSFLFTNAGTIDGPIDGAGGNDEIVGDNDGNAYVVTGQDRGTLAGKSGLAAGAADTFFNMETLRGGSGNDTFQVAGTLVGDIAGQSGNDVITFTNSGQIFGSVLGGVGVDTLVGDDDGNLFSVFGSGALAATGRGQLATKTGLFTDVENLTGGLGNDFFSFNVLGSVTGIVSGGAGTNTISGDDDGNTFSISSTDGGQLLGKMTSFNSIQNLTGGDGDDSFNVNATINGTLTGLVGTDTFLISATGTVGGSIVANESNDLVDITGRVIGNVDLGASSDRLILRAGARIDGLTNGASGDDAFDVLGSAVLGSTVHGDDGSDTFTFTSSGSLNVGVHGDSGSDTIIGDDDGNVFVIDGGDTGTLTGKIPGSFLSIENVSGGTGPDQITVNSPAGALAGNIRGGSGTDTITVQSGRPVGGQIAGDDGVDSIVIADGATVAGGVSAGAGDDLITITYTSLVATSTRTLNVDGGSGTDTLTMNGGSAGAATQYSAGPAAGSGSIVTTIGGESQTVNFSTIEPVSENQTAATMTVNGTAAANTINVIDATVAGFTEINFAGAFPPVIFQNKAVVVVNGGDGTDVINLNNPSPAVGLTALHVNGEGGTDAVQVLVNHSGNVDGGAGNDTITFSNGVLLTGTYGGNTGTDTINAAAFTSGLTTSLTGHDASGFSGVATSLLSGGFSGVDSIQAGSSVDTLNGEPVNATWELDGSNRFIESLTSVAVGFSAFELLNGGSLDDAFQVTGTRAVTLSAGGGNDSLTLANGAVLSGPFHGGTGSDRLSFSGYTSARSVMLSDNAADGYSGTTAALTGGFDGIDSVEGGAGADTLTGLNRGSTWTVNGVSDSYRDDTTGRVLTISAVETYSGGSQADTYNVAGVQSTSLSGGDGDDLVRFADGANLTGVIDGGAGSDIVDFALWTTSVAADAGGYVNIEQLRGGSAATDRLLGSSLNDTYILTGTNQGTVNGIAFESFENLQGQAGNDSFTFQAGTSVSVGVDGGSGADTLSVAALSGPLTVTLTGAGILDGISGLQTALGSVGFSNVDSLLGTGADTLAGADQNAAWTLGTVKSYTLGTKSLSFSGFSLLNGGSGNDVFNVTGNTTASLSGGLGSDTVNISAGVTLTGSVTGGSASDVLNFSAGSLVAGTFDGGSGNDTVSFAASTAAVGITLTGSAANGFSGSTSAVTGGFQNVDTVTGGSATDTLSGRNQASTWNVSSDSSYVEDATGRTLKFGSFEVLNGGSQGDVFNISGARTASLLGNGGNDDFNFASNDARLTGNISGGTGLNRLSFAGFVTTAVNVALTVSTADGFSGTAGTVLTGGFTAIDVVTGGSALTDTLTGLAGNSTWLIDASNAYSEDSSGRSLTFSAVDSLAGGAGIDTFLIQAAFTGTINSGTGQDLIDIADSAVLTGSVLTGNDADIVVVANAAVVSGSIDTGAGNDLINLSYIGSVNRTFALNAGTGDDELRLVAGEPVAASASNATFSVGPGSTQGSIATAIDGFTQSVTFDGISPTGGDRISDRQSVDLLTVNGSNSADSISVVNGEVNFTRVDFGGAFPALLFQNKPVLEVNGLGNADTITLNNTAPAIGLVTTNVSGGDGADTVNVLTSHTGDLRGGAGDDRFVIAATVTVTGATASPIAGGSGADTLDLSSKTALVVALTASTIDGFSGTESSVILSGGEFSGIDAIVGTSSGDSLAGLNSNATWQLDGTDSYIETATSRVLGLTSFDSLTGGTGNDIFEISGNRTAEIDGFLGDDSFRFMTADAQLTGVISGDDGVDVLDFSRISTAVSVTLTDALAPVADGFEGTSSRTSTSFFGINGVTGGSGAADSLTGFDTTASWIVQPGVQTYTDTVSGTAVSFQGFENLTGGDGDDSFAVTGSTAASLSGGGGDDTFTIADGAVLDGTISGGSNTVVGDTVDLSAATAALLISIGQFSGIENLTGTTFDDTLLGTSAADAFTVSGVDTVTVSAQTFSSVENIDAGGGNDSVTFSSGTSSLTGNVLGGSGNDSLNFSGLSTVGITLFSTGILDGFDGDAGTAVNSFSDINTVQGSAGNDTLTGLDTPAAWIVAAAGSYSASGAALTFSAVENLIGQSQIDSFTVSGSVTASLTGGDGSDTVVFNAGVTLTGNISGGAGSEIFTFATGASLTGTLDAGSGTDTLNYASGSTGITVILTAPDAGGGFDGTLSNGSVTYLFEGVDTVAGGAGTDSLVGDDAIATWNLGTTGTYESSGQSLAFSGINSITGGSAADTINATASQTININGGDGADVLTVADSVAISGTLSGGGADDTIQFTGAVILPAAIDGGTGSGDAVSFALGTTAVSLILSTFTNVEAVFGTTLGDSLTGTSGGDSFLVTGTGSGSIGTLNFSSFENLLGSSGDDSFAFGPSGTLSGTVNGGTGTDVIDYSLFGTGVSVNLSTGSATAVSGGSLGGISQIENATGGSGNDALTGSALNNTLTGNSGNDTLADGAGDDLLSGGLGDDHYVLTPGSADTVTDTGSTTADTLDFSQASGGIAIDLDSNLIQTVLGTHTVQLTGLFENFIGSTSADVVKSNQTVTRTISGGSGSDRFESTATGAVSWSVTGSNAATLGPVTLASFENLEGGSGDDTFNFQTGGIISGTIDGGSGTDGLNYSAISGSATVQLGNLTDIEALTGSAQSDTLIAAAGGTSFTVTGTNVGTAQNAGGTVIGFTGFENLTGGAGADNFAFVTGARLTGTLNGNGGTNVLVLGDSNDAVTLTGTGGATGVSGTAVAGAVTVTTFVAVTSLDTGAGTDSLRGIDAVAVWDVGSSSKYSSGGRELEFAGVESLLGGSSVDTFNITGSQTADILAGGGDDIVDLKSSSELIGIVDGEAGSDRLRLATSGGVTLNVVGAADGFDGITAAISGGFFNMDSLQGAGGQDTLTGTGGAAVWRLSTVSGNAYLESGRTFAFSAVENLVAGGGDDQFNVTGSHAVSVQAGGGNDVVAFLTAGSAITGSINGGSHTTGDTLDYSALTAGAAISLAGVTDFESVRGGSGSDTLTGSGGDDLFAVTATGAGTVNTLLAFSQIENLAGAGGNDTFSFSSGATMTTVDGGSGADALNVSAAGVAVAASLTAAAANGFTGTTAGISGFSGIDTLIAPAAGGDTLTGLNATAVWTLDAAATYVANGNTLAVTGFDALTGNGGADTFQVNGSRTVNISGGGGADLLVLNATGILNGAFNGGPGSDTVNLSALSSVDAIVTGAGGTDGLNLMVAAVTGGLSNVNAINAGAGTSDRLTGFSGSAQWSLGAVDSYTVSGRTVTASGFEVRTGGTADDAFAIQGNTLPGSRTHSVSGGAGADSFVINLAAASTINATAGLILNGNGGVDAVTVNLTESGDGARSLGVAWQSSASGDVNVTGLGTTGFIDGNTIESLTVNGDAANNDVVTVSGTTGADLLTARPVVNGAQVLLGGTTALPGVAGGSTGPDLAFNGLAQSNGLTVDAGNGTDSLFYDGTGGTVTTTTPTSGSIAASGRTTVAYLNTEDIQSANPMSYVLSAFTNANNGGADTFVVRRSGADIEVVVNGSVALSEDAADVLSLAVQGSSDNDTLTVDYSAGRPVPAGGLTFAGAGQTTSDALIVTGDGSSAARYTPSGTTAGSGTILIETDSIAFSGLEPVTLTAMASLTLVTPNGADSLTVDSPAAGFNRISGTSGGVVFEAVSFSGVGQVTIDGAANGGTGNDSVTFSADLVATGLAGLTVLTGSGADTVNAAAVTTRALAITTGSGNDTITGGGGSDTIAAGLGTDTLTQTVAGSQTLSDTQATGAGTDTLSGIEVAVLTGSLSDDTISAAGFTGSTTISGLAGNDVITGGSGADAISGAGGLDTLRGGAGNDTLDGGTGSDSVEGGEGHDSVLGGSGDAVDTLSGGAGDDIIDGGLGNDLLAETGTGGFTVTNVAMTGFGTDVLASLELLRLVAGTGNDLIDLTGFSGLGATVYGGAGNDTVRGSAGFDSVIGDLGDDLLIGNDGNDILLGGGGRDRLEGGNGNDRLRGQGASGDVLAGGAGDDTLDGGDGQDSIEESGDVNFTLTNSSLTGRGTDVLIGIESASLTGGASANTISALAATIATFLAGGDGNDTIRGGSGTDRVEGGAGNDQIGTGSGDDEINGGSGNDAIDGGAGTDTVVVTGDTSIAVTNTQTTGGAPVGADTITGIEVAQLNGGAGNNILDASGSTLRTFLTGGPGNDTLVGGNGDDRLDGGDGIDVTELIGTSIVLTNTTFTGTGNDQVVSIESIRLVAGATASLLDASGYTLGAVSLVGGAGNDTLRGGSGNDNIQGNDGNDVISGGGGVDVIGGGNGADQIDAGDGSDVVAGGSGNDSISGGAGDDLLNGNAGLDTIDGGDGTDTIHGDDGADLLRGGLGNDSMLGGSGADTMFGGDGNDQMFGGDGEDGMNGGLGDDALVGDFGFDTLLGGAGNDNLIGGADADTLVGGDGNDTLRGNGGSDRMAGNAGVDLTPDAITGEIDEAFSEAMFPLLME